MMPTLQKAIENNNIELLIEYLEDKTLSIEDVKTIYFAFRNDKAIVGQVAMNLSLRTSVYDREQEYSDTMVTLLTDIAANPIDMGARWAVAKNPHTPVVILKKLAQDPINLVRALVATNPSTPPDILEGFFSDEKIVRDGLSGNPNTPVKLLHVLVNDNDKMVRMRLAENPATPHETLQELLQDSDENVVLAAKANLEDRS